MTINYKNTTNQTAYTTLTHSTAATGIQMVYDDDEVMPSRTGTLFVDGTLVCPSSASLNRVACTSLSIGGYFCITGVCRFTRIHYFNTWCRC